MRKKILALLIAIISTAVIAVILLVPIFNDLTYITIIKQFFPMISQFISGSIQTNQFLLSLFEFFIVTIEITILLLITIRSVLAVALRNCKIKLFGKAIVNIIGCLIFVFFAFFYKQIPHPEFPKTINKVLNLLSELELNPAFYVIFISQFVVIIIELIRRYDIIHYPDDMKVETIEIETFIRYENKEENIMDDTYIDCNKFYYGFYKILNYLLVIVTLGFGLTFAIVNIKKFECDNIIYESKKYNFDMTYSKMFKKLFKLGSLFVITLGIYGFFIPFEYKKFIIENTHRR